jgi:hypothetical protein
MATLQVPRTPAIRQRRPRTAHTDDHPNTNTLDDSFSAPNARCQQNDIIHTYDSTHRPKTAPVQLEKSNVVRDLEKQNSNFRSARYLALQWRSRSAQWSATSSIRSFKTSSSLVSSPPPPLKEYDSDSESSFENVPSADESVVSQVSEAYKVLESWKSRSASLSVGNHSSFASESEEKEEEDDDHDHGDDNKFNKTYWDQETTHEKDPRNSREDGSDEFEMADSFAFAFAQKEEKNIVKNPAPQHISNSQCNEPKQDTTRRDDKVTSISHGAVTQTLAASEEHDEILQRLNYTPDPSRPSTYKKLLQNQLEQARSRTMQPLLVNKILEPNVSPNHFKLSTQTKSLPPDNNKKSLSNVGNPKSSNTISKLPTTQKTIWDIFDFVFTFSLLTNRQKAPPTGDYIPDDKCHAFKDKLKFKSKLLYDILLHFSHMLGRLPSLSKQQEGKKFMMLSSDCIPMVKHVRRDGK